MGFKTLQIAAEHILNWLIVYIKRYNYCNALIHFSAALCLPVELDLSLHCALNKAVTQPSAAENAVGELSAPYLKLRFLPACDETGTCIRPKAFAPYLLKELRHLAHQAGV